jgi:hypothetical protein
MRAKIITRHVFPPIPDRRFDSTAYHGGAELAAAERSFMG